MQNIEPFQVFDVLPIELFDRVLKEKANFKKKNIEVSSTLLNFKYSEERIGVFAHLCKSIEDILKQKTLPNPKPISIDFINHNGRTHMPWHKHWIWSGVDPYEKTPTSLPYENFWIAVYYPHDIYDPEYHGYLSVKLTENDNGYTFPAIPNSLVLHNGLYGHEVHMNKSNPSIRRDSCFTEWICRP